MNELAKQERTAAATLEGYVQQGRMFLFNAAQNLLQYGRVLTEAKPKLPHGEFGKWVQENFGMSERSAQGYMAVWRRFGKSETLSGIQFSSLQKMLALPEGAEEAFAVKNNLAAMTAREVEAAVKKVRAEAEAALAAAREETKQERNARLAAQQRADAKMPDKELVAQMAEKDAKLRGMERNLSAAWQEAENARRERQSAMAALDAAKRELQDTEALLTESQGEYNRLQEELLNAQSDKARGDAQRPIREQLTGEDFASAVRLFLGSAAQMPYMGGRFSQLEAEEYRQWDSLLQAVEDWARRARAALDGKERIIDGR